jgi:ribosome maturation factor RimP
MGARDVEGLVRPVVEASGLELWDLSFRKESGRMVLRVVVDRDGGVDLDTISATSERLSRRLDLEGFSDDRPYELEVASPGIERRLEEPRHFGRSIGQQVKVKTFAPVDGSKVLEGALVSADADAITVASGGEEHRIRYADIASARTVFEWGGGARPQAAKR